MWLLRGTHKEYMRDAGPGVYTRAQWVVYTLRARGASAPDRDDDAATESRGNLCVGLLGERERGSL